MNKKNIATFILASIASGAASAELYISPVVKGSVVYNEKPSAGSERGGANDVTGTSKIHGNFEIREVARPHDDLDAPVMKYGRNVPMFVALSNVVPNAKSWVIRFDDNTENVPVNWAGGDSWEDVISKIEKSSNLHVGINYSEKAIGVSPSKNISENLAYRSSRVWKIDTSKTMRENIEAWGARAGWQVAWDESVDFDFVIEHAAVLIGSFAGSNGVIDQMLYSIRDRKGALTADFYTENNVVLIKKAGYKQDSRN